MSPSPGDEPPLWKAAGLLLLIFTVPWLILIASIWLAIECFDH